MAKRNFHRFGPGVGDGQLHDPEAAPEEEEPTVGHVLTDAAAGEELEEEEPEEE